jgi:hypothetical protein
VVRLVTREDIIDKLVYIAINPVKDGLVERVSVPAGTYWLRRFVGIDVETVAEDREKSN